MNFFFYDRSDEALNLLQQCLDLDPAKRPSCQQALEHPWFKLLDVEQSDTSNDFIKLDGLT